MKTFFLKSLTVIAMTCLGNAAIGNQVITNGDFETGDFSGWEVSHTGTSRNNFYISSTNKAPVSNYVTPGPANGTYFAVADQVGPGSQTLSQSFTTNSGTNYTLSYDMFVNSHSVFNASNQYSRVDILSSAGAVLDNLYLGAPGETAYTHYSFDISNVVGNGGTFNLRFFSLQNTFYQEQGVDNVSITGGDVPEPESLALVGLGLICLVFIRRKVNKA